MDSETTMSTMEQTEGVAQHTPGPWKAEECEHGGFRIRMGSHLKGGWLYAPHHLIEYAEDTYPEDTTEWGEIEANARLIAAAPETAAERDRLLALVTEWVEALGTACVCRLEEPVGSCLPCRARAAIRSATGESER